MATNVAAGSSESQYFYEDVVYRVDKRGNVEFGIVMENDDEDMSDDNSDNEEGPKRKKGEIRVVWHPSGVEDLVNCKKVHLADRTLMPGDVVRRMIKGKDTQRGYCRDIELTACVQVVGTKQVLTDIRSEDLISLEEFGSDIAVCMDSWVGGIKMVHFKVSLTTPDGSRCVINEVDARALEHFEEKRDNDNDFPHSSEFYPGQSLWGPVHCLDEAEWISCTKEMSAKLKSKPQKITKVTVQEVETDWVGVHWQCRAYSKDGAWSDQTQPKFVVDGDDLKKLKLLNVFEPSTLQVGDRDFYVLKGNENVITREQWRKQQREIFQVPKQSPRKSRANAKLVDDVKRRDKNGKERANETKRTNVADNDHGSHINNGNCGNTGATNCLMPPPQTHNAESSDDWDTEDTGSQSDTASVSSNPTKKCRVMVEDLGAIDSEMSSGCSSMSMGKKKKGPALMTKVLKKKKLCKAKKKVAPVPLVPGSKIVVETLSTSTKATVVWQDGSVEHGIPSTQLYPIHHLDDKEFFPGDFVIDQKEESRQYGVVQSVDHQGRTAKIKWFRTYTSSQSPRPTLLEETEVSVYDLKDHPDFPYRPGTLVIRIANFEGEDAGCTAGQVLDNYPEGRVKVWWVDGHVSMCWPQDLYKVGEYDSDEGELWDDVSSDASWETELEDCFLADNDGTEQTENIKPKLAVHIEKARIAMSRLEEIFTQNPALQTTEVMRKLLEVYKDCRCMDKLMSTSFFHESHFQGLLERVRECGRANVAQRMADQVTRLFTQSANLDNNAVESVDIVPSSLQDIAGSPSEKPTTMTNDTIVEAASNVNFKQQPNFTVSKESKVNGSSEEKTDDVFINVKPNTEDSGRYSTENSKKESGSSESSGEFPLSDDANNLVGRLPSSQTFDTTLDSDTNKFHERFTNSHVASSHVCVKLCTLIKAQLVLAHAEVSRRFGVSRMSLSDAAQSESPMKKAKTEELTEKKIEEEEEEEEEEEVEVAMEQQQQQQQQQLQLLHIEPCESTVDIPPMIYTEGEGFSIEESAPDSHKFKLTMFQPTDPTNFFRTVSKELKLLRSSLPPGIWVKGFEDRIDLYSVMFRGPEKTPYEGGLFLFDFQLSADYPAAPPLCHYISYCSDRLNPNLYEDGKVCVSLLGTWAGRGTEVWTSSSTLLQVIVSIQGLILVSEPYFNEAGFERQKGSQQGRENSRMYNEMVVLKLVQSQTKLLQYPPSVFKDAIMSHFHRHAENLLTRLELWMEISEQHNNQHPLSPCTPTTFKQIAKVDQMVLPEFPLIPASRGFCITLRKTLATFKHALVKEAIVKSSSDHRFDLSWKDTLDTSRDLVDSKGEASTECPTSPDESADAKSIVRKTADNSSTTTTTTTTSLEVVANSETKKDSVERNAS